MLKDAIRQLKGLDHSVLSDSEREQILVPDINSSLLPLSQVYFNDLDLNAYTIELPQDRRKAHSEVKASLARKLGIHTLSSLNLNSVALDDEDMYEDYTTRISGILRQYPENHAPNEFLANAADAGATKFNLSLDRRQFPSCQVITETMARFQTASALLIHNDSVFQEDDFKGIRCTGLGGKQDCEDTIGRFGLGVLTAFHFTEVHFLYAAEKS